MTTLAACSAAVASPRPGWTAVHSGRPRLIFLVRALTVAALGFIPTRAAAAPLSEYELKAVFLLNFTRFVEWPQSALPPPGAPLVIGIVGVDPFGSVLDSVVAGETVGDRPLKVKRFSRHDSSAESHLLFIGRSEGAALPSLLERTKGRCVLTVSDLDRFAYRGGMIGLPMEGNRVRIQINVDQTRASQLVVSAKLLRLSLVIRDQPAPSSQPPPTELMLQDHLGVSLTWSFREVRALWPLMAHEAAWVFSAVPASNPTVQSYELVQ